MQSQLTKKVDPIYPPRARQARIQGTVILDIWVSKTGDVEGAKLFSGHPMLAPAAIEAVKQWKYRPYLLNGEPVLVSTKVNVNFTLSAPQPAQGIVGSVPGGIAPGQAGGVAGSAEAIAPHAVAAQRVRVSRGVEAGLVVKKVPPVYPPDAKAQHIQGTVVVQVIVDKQGNVANLAVASGDPQLASAAIEAVRQWKYKPYLLNQVPVEVETEVQVNFTLRN